MTRTRRTLSHQMRSRVLGLSTLALVLPVGSVSFALGPGAPGGADGVILASAGPGVAHDPANAFATTTTALAPKLAAASVRRTGADAVAKEAAALSVLRSEWQAGAPVYTPAVMTGFGGLQDRTQDASAVPVGATAGLVVGQAVAHQAATTAMPEHLYMGKRGVGLKFRF